MSLLWLPLLAASLPMKDGDFDYSLVPFPVYASPKIDGFRAMGQNNTLMSRGGLALRNAQLQARVRTIHFEGLDIELTDGPANGVDVFNRTSHIVNNAKADASNIFLNVFDRAAYRSVDFRQRYEDLLDGYSSKKAMKAGVRIVEQTLVDNIAQLKEYETARLAECYEGTMLRRADQGPYPQKTGKVNRSTLREFNLIRMKRFEYEFATLTAVHPLEHNINEERTATGKRSTKKSGRVVDAGGLKGSATLRDVKTGVEFNTTIGRAALRAWAGWADEKKWKGIKVRYKYQVCGTVDKPRINTADLKELLP